jgi:hypothetical protein
MKKNGFIEVVATKDIDELKKGDKVFVSSTEFGQLDDDAVVTCYKGKKELFIPKNSLEITK